MENTARIGLGAFPFSNVLGEVTGMGAERVVKTFLDLGGEYIQTAPYYKGVDPLMGKILKNIPREKYYFSTLCAKNRQGIRSGRYEAVIEQCDDSLQHLGIEHIDLYMTSTTKSDVPFSETIGAMKDLQKQGKIRDIGVCNVTLAQLEEYNANGDVQYIQNRFSLICQSFEEDFISYCKLHNIEIVPYNVIERGLLTNGILKEIELREGDIRRSAAYFREEAVKTIRNWIISQLQPIAQSTNASIEALALWWTLQQPQIARVVVGATKPEQIQSSLRAANISGSETLLNQINEAYDILIKEIRTKHSKGVNEFLGNVYK